MTKKYLASLDDLPDFREMLAIHDPEELERVEGIDKKRALEASKEQKQSMEDHQDTTNPFLKTKKEFEVDESS